MKKSLFSFMLASTLTISNAGNIFADVIPVSEQDYILSLESIKPFATTDEQLLQMVTYTITAFDAVRDANQLIVYKSPTYKGTSPTAQIGYTDTNPWGAEAVIEGNRVKTIAGAGNNQIVGGDGNFIVSGHGKGRDWMNANMKPGKLVTYDEANMTLTVSNDRKAYIDKAKATLKDAEDMYNNANKSSIEDAKAKQAIADAKSKIVEAEAVSVGGTDKEIEAIKLALEADTLAHDGYFYSIESRTSETRGVWHRPTEKTVDDVRRTLQTFKDSGFNMVLVETFYHGYVIYPDSKYARLRPEFNNGFDLLQTYIDIGKEMGIEIHAWVEDFYIGNKILIGNPATDSISGSPIIDENPTWAALTKDGKDAVTTESGYMFMNAAMPEVQNFLLDLYKEMLTKYEVNGIQLDYIRYPVSNGPDTSVGFDDYSIAKFNEYSGIDIRTVTDVNSEEWQLFTKWKADNITNFVAKVTNMIKTLRQELKRPIYTSTAVFGDPSAYTKKSQDWETWMEKGMLDFISPMSYMDAPADVKDEVGKMVQKFGDIPNFAGVSPMFHKLPVIESTKQVLATREAGAKGIIFFDSKGVLGTQTGYDDPVYTSKLQIDALKKGAFRTTSTIPYNPMNNNLVTINENITYMSRTILEAKEVLTNATATSQEIVKSIFDLSKAINNFVETK